MVHAEYDDGRTYHAASLDDVNLKEFLVDGLVSLRVAGFVWRWHEHGNLLAHGMRTCQRGTGMIAWRIYIAEAEKCKIFVFSQGDYRVLPDWIPGTKFFDPMRWPAKLTPQRAPS